MTMNLTIRKAEGKWVVRAGGAVLAESENALEVTEGDAPFVIYFPREDVAMAFLDKSETTSDCARKGTATYYSIVTKTRELTDAGWSYESPEPEAERLAGFLAFTSNDAVTVERL